MGKPTGFLEYDKKERGYEKPAARKKTYKEFLKTDARGRGARAGRALHGLRDSVLVTTSCPVNNQIPDWNSLVHKDQWKAALRQPALHQQLPGIHRPRLCLATVRSRVRAQHRRERRSRSKPSNAKSSIAVGKKAGSSRKTRRARHRQTHRHRRLGPCGPRLRLQQLARAGHAPAPCSKRATASAACCAGGIPDFKMEKRHIDRRIKQMETEGVIFRTGMLYIGIDVSGAAPARRLSGAGAGRQR